jgi:TetR/AcrR family transcriptional regulator, transcriptional repressor for nem operon
MGRARNFSDDEVIARATRVFATHGFSGASMSMLCESTGLGKQSLYNAFGDKQALYIKALDCYVAQYDALKLAMASAPSGFAALQVFFEQLVSACANADPAKHSCMVSAGLLEATGDPTITANLQHKWQASHELLRASVERGQKDGSVSNPLPSAQLADLLMSAMSGLRVSARVDASPHRLRQTVNLVLGLLQSPGP